LAFLFGGQAFRDVARLFLYRLFIPKTINQKPGNGCKQPEDYFSNGCVRFRKIQLQYHCHRSDIEGEHGRKNEEWIGYQLVHGLEFDRAGFQTKTSNESATFRWLAFMQGKQGYLLSLAIGHGVSITTPATYPAMEMLRKTQIIPITWLNTSPPMIHKAAATITAAVIFKVLELIISLSG